jgi:hypothetical protein
MTITTNTAQNLEAANSYLVPLVDRIDDLAMSCKARGTASSDQLFIDLSATLDALTRYLVNLQMALELNSNAEERS